MGDGDRCCFFNLCADFASETSPIPAARPCKALRPILVLVDVDMSKISKIRRNVLIKI